MLTKTNHIQLTRKTFDRSIQALPITQHGKIWDLYVSWSVSTSIPELSIRVYKRYIQYNESAREEFIQYLLQINKFEEAIEILIKALDESTEAASNHKIMIDICEICCNHGNIITQTVDVESILRSGIKKFSDEVGKFWCKLADYYLRQGLIQKSFDVYEEAIDSVTTVRDFTIVFESYVKVTEAIVAEKIKALKVSNNSSMVDELYVDMQLTKLEFLIDHRPLYVNSIILRQNPHNVYEWHKRIKLLRHDEKKLLLTYVEAINAVDPHKSNGKVSSLWLSLSAHYDNKNDYGNVRSVFQKAVEVNFKSVDELAFVYCAWAEFELKIGNFESAIKILQQAIKPSSPNKISTDSERNSHLFLYKNVKIWNFYLDMEENIGTLETVRAAYDRVFDLKIVTLAMVLNYSKFLLKYHFFEESFKVYERAVSMFNFPEVKCIWLKYLSEFMNRYNSSKMERLRDLFEQVISKCPPNHVAEFIEMYAKAEEKFGFERNAVAIYDRSLKIIPSELKMHLYRLFIKKVEIYFGVTKTRPIYERAILDLDEMSSKQICIEYAHVERNLGEIDRARNILKHGSQLADPKIDSAYWNAWKHFEELHGNEETFRDMLRIKRAVEAVYSQVTSKLAYCIKTLMYPCPF